MNAIKKINRKRKLKGKDPLPNRIGKGYTSYKTVPGVGNVPVKTRIHTTDKSKFQKEEPPENERTKSEEVSSND